MQENLIGIPWFEEDDYQAFRETLPKYGWEDTYGGWLHGAERELDAFVEQGIPAFKARMNSDRFVAWCIVKGFGVNTNALAAYSDEIAHRYLSGGDAR